MAPAISCILGVPSLKRSTSRRRYHDSPSDSAAMTPMTTTVVTFPELTVMVWTEVESMRPP